MKDCGGEYVLIDWDKVNTLDDFKALMKYCINPRGKVYIIGLDLSKFEHLLKDED